MALFGIFGDGRERAGYLLYGAAVAAARHPYFYAALGVPDTVDGRFDMVGLHTYLVIRRLCQSPGSGAKLGQAVFDAMFNDMDLNLREMGVSDLSVGKKNRTMWEAFYGRAHAYAEALDQHDAAALAATLVRNVWRGQPGGAPPVLARIVAAQDAALARQDEATMARGQVSFLDPCRLAAVPA